MYTVRFNTNQLEIGRYEGKNRAILDAFKIADRTGESVKVVDEETKKTIYEA